MKKLLTNLLLCLALAAVAGKKSASGIVAYLLNVKGDALISRHGKAQKASRLCSELQAGDKIILRKNASASISYKNSFVKISYPQSHTVSAPSNEDKQPKAGSSIVLRGKEKESQSKPHDWEVMVNPEVLKIEPVSMVRKDRPVLILSPSVKSFSLTPDIFLQNQKKMELTVSLYKFEGRGMKLMGAKTIKSELLRWSDTDWQPLQPGNFYQIRALYQDENNRISASSHSFATFTQKEKETISKTLTQQKDELDSSEAKSLVRLCTLFKNDCLGEAYILADSLLEKSPENSFLQKLHKKCKSSIVKNND